MVSAPDRPSVPRPAPPGRRSCFVDGRSVESTSGEVFTSVDPSTNEVICEVEAAGPAEVDAAVAAARRAFADWSRTPPVERRRILDRAVAILRERNDELAALETLDTGKPVAETTTVDVVTGADVLEFYAGLAPAVAGESLDYPGEGFALVQRRPLGVCAGIGAWNYPLQIALWKSAPALACGNTMVFKPAELTPLTAVSLAEIYREAGLPPGVFNVVHGDARVGRLLTRHPGIDKVSLTGEVTTGRAVMADASTTLKAVTLELGGKSPLIVFPDADLERAAEAAVTHNFFSSGQVCSNATRVFVHAEVHDEVCERIAERTRRLVVGDPFDPATDIGPLISAEHRARVEAHLEAAAASGARLVVGGSRPADPSLASGNYVAPTVYADCRDDMSFVAEEVFGPLMAVLRFDDEAEVVARANATPYGLAAGVFTRDFDRAHRVADALEAGVVWINDYNVLPPSLPFGGHKQSGLGHENGVATIEHYTRRRSIYARVDPRPPAGDR